jgi:Vitamin K epoxide reductase family
VNSADRGAADGYPAGMSASPASPKGARASANAPAGDAHARRGAASLSWMQASAFVLCILGPVDSAYQTYTHFTGTGLAGCSAAGDPCVLVQTSSYAYVAGIPVAVLGASPHLPLLHERAYHYVPALHANRLPIRSPALRDPRNAQSGLFCVNAES